jgi:hypothetical protein
MVYRTAGTRGKESLVRFAMVAMAAIVIVAMTHTGARAQDPRATPADKTTPKKLVRSVNGSVRTSSNEAIVVVGRDKGRDVEWTFALEPTTSIRKGNKSIVGGDLKTGDTVHVRFAERDGKAVAESVLVRAPKTPPAAKK